MEKDDSFWLNIGYLIFLALVAIVVWNLAVSVGDQTGWTERYDNWYLPASYGVSALFGIGAAYFLRSDAERHEYLLLSVGELRKVAWPSGEDTKRMTTIVCIVVAIFAAIMLVFDLSWSYLLRELIGMFT